MIAISDLSQKERKLLLKTHGKRAKVIFGNLKIRRKGQISFGGLEM